MGEKWVFWKDSRNMPKIGEFLASKAKMSMFYTA
jgi:hypothetical protein